MLQERRVWSCVPGCRGRSVPRRSLTNGLSAVFLFIFLTFVTGQLASAADCSNRTLPGTLQAEAFCEQSGVQLETTSDSGGGQNVGWIDSGDWMSYRVNIEQSGTYRVSYRVASAIGDAQFVLEGQGGSPQYGQIDVPNTGGWQSWRTLSHTVELNAGVQSIAVSAWAGGFNLNWIRFTKETVNPPSNTLMIEAEDYQNMFGIRTQPTADAGGGLNVGWVHSGDWLAYHSRNIACAGQYTVEYRVASAVNGGTLRLERSGGSETFGSISIPGTGGWQNWQTVSHQVHLPGGDIAFGLVATSGRWNLNWFRVTEVACDTPTPTVTPPPQGGLTAVQAAAQMGKGFNLGQMFESDQHPRNFAAAKAKIDAYYALGHRNVRVPITWTEEIAGSALVNDPNVGDVNRNHPRLLEIVRTVDYALSLDDMYVIINTHHETGLKDNDRSWVLERLWQDITDIFGDRNEQLLFEVLNEPHKSSANNPGMNPEVLREMTGRAYDQIRARNPQRIIIIGGNQWFGAHEMAITWPHLDDVGSGDDPYVMATFHHYDPWSFNGSNQGDYADNWNDANISDPMDLMTDWASSVGNGMPVYIGEWGVGWGSRYSELECNNVRRWYTRFNALYASDRGQPTAVWDDGGWFKIFDHATDAFGNNLYQCIDGSCDWSGDETRFYGCQ